MKNGKNEERDYTMVRFNKSSTKRRLVKMAKADTNGNLNLLINKLLEQHLEKYK